MNLQSRLLPRYIGLALVSGSVLALQVIFTRVFSIMIWYHFTYLVIGVALLGGGAAGTFLAIRQWDTDMLDRRLGNIALGFSVSILFSLLVVSVIQVDPLGDLKRILISIPGLGLYFLALFAAFFLGGLTVAGAFSRWSKEAHRLYFADLLGASISTLAVVWFVQALTGPGAILLVALMALAAALMFGVQLPQRWRLIFPLLAAVEVVLFLVVVFVGPIQFPIPASKELGRLMRKYDVTQPEYTQWNPVARVDVLQLQESDFPPLVGGLSSVYDEKKSRPVTFHTRHVTFDGTSMSTMYRFEGDLSDFEAFDYALISSPFILGPANPSVLNIGVGGGVDILLARYYDASRVTAIDINSAVVDLIQSGEYADFTGNLGAAPDTVIETAEGRSFLLRNQEKYDIIQGIGLDNFAALSGGAYVLSESYIYTVEAFEEALNGLTPTGVFAWTRSINSPPRETLRLTGLAAEALRRRGVSDPASYIAVVANESGDTATLLVAIQPFAEADVKRLRDWAASNNFTMLHDPFEALDTPYAEYLNAPDPRVFEAAYPLNIHPVYDDNPFFYNYYRWTDLQQWNREDIGDLNNRLPIGNLIMFAMLGFSVLTAAVFIVIPLLRYRRGGLQTPAALPMLAYFSALGLGYIFVEIVLIQRFTLFIGYPTYAITTTIFSMLFFSAVGSLVSQRFIHNVQRLRILLAAVVVLILVYIVVLPSLFSALLYLSDLVRILLSIVIIAPLAFFMGMPFPTGLRQLSSQADSLIPWAWGMNGVFSVLGSALVILISMLSNFTTAMFSAALFYGVALAVAAALWKVAVIKTAP